MPASHTHVTLEVSTDIFLELKAKLASVGEGWRALKNGTLDMQGVALKRPATLESTVSSQRTRSW